MQSHEVDFEIHGDDMQFVEIGLDPSETVIAEAGAMMYLDHGITFETKMMATLNEMGRIRAEEREWTDYVNLLGRHLYVGSLLRGEKAESDEESDPK